MTNIAHIQRESLRDDKNRRIVDSWRVIRDCMEGEDAIKERGVEYLPIPSGFDNANDKRYLAYRTRASFYAVTERMVLGMLGLARRKEPKKEFIEQMRPVIEGLTYRGRTFDGRLWEEMYEQLSVGRVGTLVDLPPEGEDSDDPYFTTFKAEEILAWDVDMVGAYPKLVKVRLLDSSLSDEDFDTLREAAIKDNSDAEFYLDLVLEDGVYVMRRMAARYSTQTKVRTEQILEEVVPTVNGRPLDFIPFSFCNTFDTRPALSKAPMIDLCRLNLAHYRNSADYEHALYLTAQPTPYVVGLDNSTLPEDQKLKAIGSSALWTIADANAKVGMLEFSGQGVEAQRQAMLDKQERMAFLGARLVRHESGRETAEAARMRYRGETSVLVAAVAAMEEHQNRLLSYASVMKGLPEDSATITLNRDFVDKRLLEPDVSGIVKAWLAGTFGDPTGEVAAKVMYTNFRDGEWFPMDLEFDDYAAALAQVSDRMELLPDAPQRSEPQGSGADVSA
jgi:hypothetical protein